MQNVCIITLDYIIIIISLIYHRWFFVVGTDRPALKYLNRHVRAYIGTKWHDVGVELLNVQDEPALNAIKVNFFRDVDECTAEMLQLWLKRKPDASWNQLIKAFRARNINLETLASEIEGMLSKGTYCIMHNVNITNDHSCSK